MAEAYVVVWVYVDYEGSSTTLVKAFSDPDKASALAQDINAAVKEYRRIEDASNRRPLPRGIHNPGPKRDAILAKWHEDRLAVQRENTIKAIELYNILVATHGEFGANLITPSLDGAYPIPGFLDTDPQYQSAEVETIPFD